MSEAVLRDTGTRPGMRLGRRGLRRTAAVATLMIVIAGAAGFAHAWWTVGRFIETTDDAYVGGNITAIAPHVAGFIDDVMIQDNQQVKAGQPLIQLDPRDFRIAFVHAEATVIARQADLAGLQARLALQQSVIREQEADLGAKTARASFAAQDSDRYRSLARTNAGSRQDAERSSTLGQEARAALASSAAGLDAARQQLAVLHASIDAATASVAQAEADLQTARLDLGYTLIRSPINGTIGNRAAQRGAYVSTGGYLLSVIPAAGLWVDANFKEDQLERMRPGQPVRIVADVIPNHPFDGRVSSLAPGTGAVFSVIPPENATGNFTKIVQRVPVRITLDTRDTKLSLLRPGLSITAEVDTRLPGEGPRAGASP